MKVGNNDNVIKLYNPFSKCKINYSFQRTDETRESLERVETKLRSVSVNIAANVIQNLYRFQYRGESMGGDFHNFGDLDLFYFCFCRVLCCELYHYISVYS